MVVAGGENIGVPKKTVEGIKTILGLINVGIGFDTPTENLVFNLTFKFFGLASLEIIFLGSLVLLVVLLLGGFIIIIRDCKVNSSGS